MNSAVIDQFKQVFPGIVDLQSETYGRVSPHIEHQNVYIDNAAENDIEILVNLIRDQVLKDLLVDSEENRPNKSVIVFCENKAKLNRICEELG